jgi:crotonobetainyl-CoA:carnitine CoA-transferase CaiB-like acyl-CoA transferase
MGPLTGIRILDGTEGIAGPMATMYLADFGAEVLKIEPIGGERGRADPGFPLLNRNKAAASFDLGGSELPAPLEALIRGAHLCAFSQPMSWLLGRRLDPGSVHAINPACVYLHVPSFVGSGPDGGLPESAELLAALTGVAASQYSFDDVPVDPVIPHLLYGQAIWAAGCASAALFERNRSGHGQLVTVGGIHGWLMTMTGSVTRRPGAPVVHPAGGPGGPVPFYRLYECADGEWLFLAGLTPAFQAAAFGALGIIEELLADPRLGGELIASALPENAPWVIERVKAAFRTRPRSEWLRVIAEAGCPCGPVWDRQTWFDHPQVAALGMRVAMDDPARGVVEMPGLPLNLAESPAELRWAAPPLPDAATATVPVWDALPRAQEPAPAAAGPLAGIRVLDLGSIIAGTYAATLLRALGADVVKVESPTGDNLRNFGPTFFGFNLGKRSLVLDLSRTEGRDAFYQLVRTADVVVDNYRPGVLERLQADYPSLRALNPRIICVSVTGYGGVGPLGSVPGFDLLLQAASGMMRAQGGDSDPVFYLLPVNDVASAATAALGAVLALLYRENSGYGQRVTTSLAAQSVMMQCRELVRYEGRPPARTGGRDYPGPGAFDRLYPVRDGWIRLQAVDRQQRAAVLGALGLPPETPDDGPAAEAALGQSLAALGREDAVSRLSSAGCVAAPVRTIAEVTEHPLFAEERVVRRLTLADSSEVYAAGDYVRFGRTQAPPALFVPGLGEHSIEVLDERGFAPDAVTQLLETAVTAQGGPLLLPLP